MYNLLKKAIERELVRKPTVGFSDRVMNSVYELKATPAYLPIISTPILILIGVLLLVIIGAVFFAAPETSGEIIGFSFFDSAVKFLNNSPLSETVFFSKINLLVLSGTSMAIFLLLFFDSLFYKKR